MLILARQGDGHTQCPAARNDGDLVNVVLSRQIVACDGVTCLVVGGVKLFLILNDPALFLRACDDLDGGLLDVLLDDSPATLSGGEKGGFVEQVFEVGTGKA